MSKPSLRKRWSTYCSTATAPVNGPMIAPESDRGDVGAQQQRRPCRRRSGGRTRGTAPRSANGTAITWLTITVARKASRKMPRIRQNWPRLESRPPRRSDGEDARAARPPRSGRRAGTSGRGWPARQHRASSTTNRPSRMASTRPAVLSETADAEQRSPAGPARRPRCEDQPLEQGEPEQPEQAALGLLPGLARGEPVTDDGPGHHGHDQAGDHDAGQEAEDRRDRAGGGDRRRRRTARSRTGRCRARSSWPVEAEHDRDQRPGPP